MSSCNRPETLLLLLMCLSLFCSGLQAEAEAEAEAEVEAPTSPDTVKTIDNLLNSPPLERFDEVIERPLFMANRRPRPKSAVPTSGGNEQTLRETWKLTGITITKERVMALFSERNGDKRLRLEVGMSLDEYWQLEEVEKDWVSVVSGDESVRLQLRQPREILPVSSDSKTPANSATGSEPAASGKKRSPPQEPASPSKGKVQTL